MVENEKKLKEIKGYDRIWKEMIEKWKEIKKKLKQEVIKFYFYRKTKHEYKKNKKNKHIDEEEVEQIFSY